MQVVSRSETISPHTGHDVSSDSTSGSARSFNSISYETMVLRRSGRTSYQVPAAFAEICGTLMRMAELAGEKA